MQSLKLLCGKCATPLAPAFSGMRCPRFSACGRGGIVEKIGFQPATTLLDTGTDAQA